MNREMKKLFSSLKRKKDAKKGDSGRVLIIGGSTDYVGAIALAGLAAMRAGCDWVTVATPEKIAWAVNALSPDLVTKKLKGESLGIKNAKTIDELIKRHDCVLIGNGADVSDKTKKLFKYVAAKANKPIVYDAASFHLLKPKDVSNCILTPHIREAEVFFSEKFKGKEPRYIISAIQKQIGAGVVVLLKGRTDYIITKNKYYTNKTGNPGMAKAGTGDVLAGLCAGFLAQTKDLVKSARLAAYINGAIGDVLLKERKGTYSYIASDIVDDYNRLIKKVE